jgi:hypothetical protein
VDYQVSTVYPVVTVCPVLMVQLARRARLPHLICSQREIPGNLDRLVPEVMKENRACPGKMVCHDFRKFSGYALNLGFFL